MTKKNEVITEELLSTSEIGLRLNINRNTVARKLKAAGIAPVEDSANKKLYLLTDDVEDILRDEEGGDPQMKAAKLRKLKAEVELKTIELAIKRGEMISVAQLIEDTARIFGKLYRRTVVNLPKKLARPMHEADTAEEAVSLLQQELTEIFEETCRENPKHFSKEYKLPSINANSRH